MRPTDRWKHRSDYDNWLSISIGIDREPSPLNGKKYGRRYLSNQKNPGGGVVPEEFGNTDVIKFNKKGWDRDVYFYQEGVIYLSCDIKEATKDYFPSCQMYSSYNDLELYVAFSYQYKAEFLKIESLVRELFASFEQP